MRLCCTGITGAKVNSYMYVSVVLLATTNSVHEQ